MIEILKIDVVARKFIKTWKIKFISFKKWYKYENKNIAR